MLKLIALKRYLEGVQLWNPERIDAAAENGTPEFSGSEASADLLLFRNRYTGTIEVFGTAGNLTDLLAHVLVWLELNGGNNDSLDGWEGEPVDHDRSDITLTLTFEEDVRYVPAPANYAGADKITWNGADWVPGSKAADLANALAGVSGTVQQ